MNYMDSDQLLALEEHIAAQQRLRESALRDWAKQPLLEFCEVMGYDKARLVPEGSTSTRVDVQCPAPGFRIEVGSSGYNCPTPDVWVGAWAPRSMDFHVKHAETVLEALNELAGTVRTEADTVRAKANELDQIATVIEAYRAHVTSRVTPAPKLVLTADHEGFASVPPGPPAGGDLEEARRLRAQDPREWRDPTGQY